MRTVSIGGMADTRTGSIGGVTALTLAATLAWVVVSAGTPNGEVDHCLTKADVAFHLERSRSGISLSCNEAVRERNLRRAGSR